MSESSQGIPNITFFSRNSIKCPLCRHSFQKEELQTGRGRINAGLLTNELRRSYIPTQKYGAVNPLLYPLAVCPNCYFSGMPSDFQKLPETEGYDPEKDNRQLAIKKIFGKSIDFSQPRDIVSGLASYILGFMSTTHLDKNSSPTARRGLYSLRAAWLASDLYDKTKLKHFEDLKEELYRQALFNYELALDRQLKSVEPFDGFIWMGPDVDANFGYDGIIYVISILMFKQLSFAGKNEQVKKLELIKRNLSRIFGIGKKNRDKPEVLIDYTRALYFQINDILKNLASEGIDIGSAMNIEGLDDVEM